MLLAREPRPELRQVDRPFRFVLHVASFGGGFGLRYQSNGSSLS